MFAIYVLVAQNGPAQTSTGTAVVKQRNSAEPPCSARPADAPQLTRKQATKLRKTAKSAEDYCKVAGYYRADAERLDAEGAAYEKAASAYRHGANIKNLTSPTTAAQYEYRAKQLHEEAKSDRGLRI